MLHQLRTNLLLLLVIILLAVVVWWSQPEPVARLSALTPEQITKIEISSPPRDTLIMTLSGDQWLIGGEAALNSRVKQLLEICQTPSLSQFPAPLDLKPFGLDQPGMVLQLNQAQFLFGDLDPINGWRYVLHKHKIHLIGDGFQHHLMAPIEAWLERPDA